MIAVCGQDGDGAFGGRCAASITRRYDLFLPIRLNSGRPSLKMPGERATETNPGIWHSFLQFGHAVAVNVQRRDLGPIWVHWLPNTVMKRGATRRTNLSGTTG